jgi:hypothetical protein
MYRQAVFSAAQPNSSLKAPEAAIPGCCGPNESCSKPSPKGAVATRISAAIWANGRSAKSDFGASGSLPSRLPFSTRGHTSGPNRRPAALRRSASATPPFWVSADPKTSLKAAAKAPLKPLPGSAKKALLGTWEPGPLAGLRLV